MPLKRGVAEMRAIDKFTLKMLKVVRVTCPCNSQHAHILPISRPPCAERDLSATHLEVLRHPHLRICRDHDSILRKYSESNGHRAFVLELPPRISHMLDRLRRRGPIRYWMRAHGWRRNRRSEERMRYRSQ